jgi:hypothetical protein
MASCNDQPHIHLSIRLDIDQFKEALGCALARYPLVAGHLLHNNDHYFIEMADHSILVSFTDNLDLSKCPFNTNVVIDKDQTSLEPYLSRVQTEKLLDSSQYEPLLHVKLTRIAQSGEMIMGISWAHVVGDAASCLHFLNTIS